MSYKGVRQLFGDMNEGATSPASPQTAQEAGPRPATSLTDLKKMFDDFRSTTATNSTQRLIDQDYYDGNQSTAQEKALLSQRGQPDIVVNRCRVAINGILGVIARSLTDPKCWGRNPQDEESASVATDCIRYASETARLNRMKVDLAKDNLISGTCAVLIGVDEDLKIELTQIRWEEFFVDPRSRRADCKDARYMGMAKWMFIDDVTAMYQDAELDLESSTQGGSISLGATDERFEDRPVNQGWIDLRSKRVMVVEIYYKERGGWCKAVFYYNGVLEQGESPYTDEKGRPTCPIEGQSCYVDRDNNRYGMMKDMRDLQDEINKRRSKLLHIVNSSQIQAVDPSAIEVDADTAREEAARPDGVIPLGWQKVPTNDMAQGQSMLLSETKGEMERFGPNPAILGRQGADSSGRALLTRQQAGLVELAVVLDQLEDHELRIYRQIWARIKQYWRDPMVIRVTDSEEAPKFVFVNQPQPNPNMGKNLMMGGEPNGSAMMDPATGAPTTPPNTLGYSANIAEMDVDIMIDTTPATATIMQEQFKDIMDLVGSNPVYAQQVPFTLFLELMPGVPRKRQLMKMLQSYKQQQEQQAQQQQQEQQARQDAMLKARIEELASKAGLNSANAQKAIGDMHSTAIRAETQAGQAVNTATVAHDEVNIKRYQALMEAAAAQAEADVSGGEGASDR